MTCTYFSAADTVPCPVTVHLVPVHANCQFLFRDPATLPDIPYVVNLCDRIRAHCAITNGSNVCVSGPCGPRAASARELSASEAWTCG